MAVEVIAGTYLRIVSVDVPSSAEAGEYVRARIKITNPSSIDLRYVSPRVAGNDVPAWSGTALTLYAGSTVTWTYTFKMPDKSVSFDIEARYWGTDDQWHTNDTQRVTVSLYAPPAAEWQQLDYAWISVKVGVAPAVWQMISETTLSLTVGVAPMVWQMISETTLSLTVGVAPTVWQELDSTMIAVPLGVGPPIPPPPPPPTKCAPGEIELFGYCASPWLIVGGAVAASGAIALLATAEKKKKKIKAKT